MYTNIIDLDERKPNSNNILANLPDEDQRRIHEWLKNLSYEATVEQIALPRPEGLDLKIHYTSLRNYYRRFIHPDRIVRRNMLLDTYRDMAEMAIDDPIPFMIVVAEGLQRHLADLAHEPKPSLKDLERLFRIFHKIQDMDLKRERLNLAKAKAGDFPVGRVPKSAPTNSPTSMPTSSVPQFPVPSLGRVPSPGVPSAPQATNPPSMSTLSQMLDRLESALAPAAQNIKEYQTTSTEAPTEQPEIAPAKPKPITHPTTSEPSIKEYQALANLECHLRNEPLPYPYPGYQYNPEGQTLPAAAGLPSFPAPPTPIYFA